MKPMFKIGDIVRIKKVLQDVLCNDIAYPVNTVGVVCGRASSGEEPAYEVIALHECVRFSHTGATLVLDVRGKNGFLYEECELEKVSLADMKVVLSFSKDEKTYIKWS